MATPASAADAPDGVDDAGQAGQRRRSGRQTVDLEAEDRLALDAALELGRRARGEDPAVVDDGDVLAQLVGLGHVVGREEDRAAWDGGPPLDDQLADRPGGGDVEAERRLVEEEDPGVVEQAAGKVHLLSLAGRERRDTLEPAAPRARPPR